MLHLLDILNRKLNACLVNLLICINSWYLEAQWKDSQLHGQILSDSMVSSFQSCIS